MIRLQSERVDWKVALLISTLIAACGSGGGESSAGKNCKANADCGEQGECVGLGSGSTGICVVHASAPCSAPGSSAECGAGERCWQNGADESICWADCSSQCGSAGGCDPDGSCVPEAWTHTSCACQCSCSFCTATVDATCSGGGSACGSCSTVCRDVCAEDPLCGSYSGSSGSCS